MTISLIVAVFTVALALFNGVIAFLSSSNKEYEPLKKFNKQLGIGVIASLVVLIIIAVLGLLGVNPFAKCPNLGIFSAFSSFIFTALYFISAFINDGWKQHYSFIVKTVVVVLLAELTLFNFNSYDFLAKDYPLADLKLYNAKVDGGKFNVNSSVNITNGTIEFTGLKIPVGSITVNVANENFSTADIVISYADSSNKEYRAETITLQTIKNYPSSFTTPCALSGNVSKLKFSYTSPVSGTTVDATEFAIDNPAINPTANNPTGITINSIVLNNPIPIDFNFIRILTFLFFAILPYLLINLDTFKQPIKNCVKLSKIGTVFMAVIFVLCAFWITSIYRQTTDTSIIDEFKSTTGNQINQELVDAFEAGQVSLLKVPDESLLKLDNPYDWSERTKTNATHEWDHVLFNGKYYSYYGIAPVLLLFLPYHLLTGFYFPTVWAVFIFGAIGIVFLVKFLMEFFRRYFPNIPYGFAVIAVLLSLMSCGVWFNFALPNFYEIAQTCGFAFTTLGAYFMLTSNILEGSNIKHLRLIISSASLGFAVLSRPTLVVYSFVAVIVVVVGIIRMIKNNTNKSKGKAKYIKCLLSAFIPLGILGITQMLYNYARFGSFFDFGIDYSLTINDFTRAESHISQVFLGYVNYLFVFPYFNHSFPYLHSNITLMNVPGYYFLANSTACGILFRALPTFSYLFVHKAYKIAPNKKKKSNAIILLATCIIAPMVIIFTIAESGYGVRYATDFSWQILLGAFVIAFILYSSVQASSTKKILEKAMAVALIGGIIVNFAQVYEYLYNSISNYPNIASNFIHFGSIFEFWI